MCKQLTVDLVSAFSKPVFLKYKVTLRKTLHNPAIESKPSSSDLRNEVVLWNTLNNKNNYI